MRHYENRWEVGGEKVAYGYASGRLRAMEATLLLGRDLRASLQQAQTEGWDRLLDRLAYPQDPVLLERIADGRLAADRVLKELAPEAALSYGLLLYQSYHNLKVFLKGLLPDQEGKPAELSSRFQGGIPESFADLLFWESEEKPELLWNLVLDVLMGKVAIPSLPEEPESWSQEMVGMDELGPDCYRRTHLPPIFTVAVANARETYIRSLDMGQMDATLDYYYYGHLSALARLAKIPFLKTYSVLKSDLANLNSLYRSRRLYLEEEALEWLWVPGGQCDRETYRRLYHADLASWREAFSATPVCELVDLAYDLAHPHEREEQEPSSGRFAREADNLLMDLARTGLQTVYGAPVLAGYWLARQTEAQNLRLALSLVALGKSTEEVEALLREVYIHG